MSTKILLRMGCKFSITLDQQRPKTPSWFSDRKSMRKNSTDQTVQTEEDKASPDAETVLSSPEQVNVKTISKKKQASQWKP